MNDMKIFVPKDCDYKTIVKKWTDEGGKLENIFRLWNEIANIHGQIQINIKKVGYDESVKN